MEGINIKLGDMSRRNTNDDSIDTKDSNLKQPKNELNRQEPSSGISTNNNSAASNSTSIRDT
jgi:hypothetical protein